jgi:hypothetical protein
MMLEFWMLQLGWQDTKKDSCGTVEWLSRTEYYFNDPEKDSDTEQWQADIMCLLDD